MFLTPGAVINLKDGSRASYLCSEDEKLFLKKDGINILAKVEDIGVTLFVEGLSIEDHKKLVEDLKSKYMHLNERKTETHLLDEEDIEDFTCDTCSFQTTCFEEHDFCEKYKYKKAIDRDSVYWPKDYHK